MTESGWRFPEFGDGGDHIGARRSRRAFRRCVAFCVFFVGVLWVSEWFLRYDHADRLYLSALTKPHADSARSLLRQAVKHDEEARERPSTRYLQALAAREEYDRVIETYERAYVLDPGNAPLAIRYACELHKRDLSGEAAKLLAEASEKAPDNALPRYVHAAVMPWAAESKTLPLSASFTHIARTNSGGRSVQFPRPLWFGGLPQDGYWYADLQRYIVDAICGPVLQFVSLVESHAGVDLSEGNQRNWPSRLEHLDTMGQRFVQAGALPANGELERTPGSILVVYTGLEIRRSAVSLMSRFAKSHGEESDAEHAALAANINEALAELRDYGASRNARIEDERRKFAFPLVMCGWTMAVLAGVYVLVLAAVRIVARNKAAGTIPHPKWGRAALVIGPAGFFLLLVLTAVMQQEPGGGPNWMPGLEYVWWTILGLYAVVGLAYPSLVLPAAAAAARRVHPDSDSEAALLAAKHARRMAYCTLLRRYYGIAIGFTLCFICLWVVLYRVVYALYPWQLELLVLEPTQEETVMLERVLSRIV